MNRMLHLGFFDTIFFTSLRNFINVFVCLSLFLIMLKYVKNEADIVD